MRKQDVSTKLTIPTFLKGFASAFDITGQSLFEVPNLYMGFQRDAEALRGDWQRVGNDLRVSMSSCSNE